MFNKGDIVYHDNLKFSDGEDDKKQKRPCLVLFELDLEDGKYVCTAPFTSQVNNFNKRPYNYLFTPYIIYKYKTLCFLKLNSTNIYKVEFTHLVNRKVDPKFSDLALKKILEYNEKYGKKNDLIRIKMYMDHSKSINKLENEKQLKKTKM